MFLGVRSAKKKFTLIVIWIYVVPRETIYKSDSKWNIWYEKDQAQPEYTSTFEEEGHDFAFSGRKENGRETSAIRILTKKISSLRHFQAADPRLSAPPLLYKHM
jgi:hypothetical protein